VSSPLQRLLLKEIGPSREDRPFKKKERKRREKETIPLKNQKGLPTSSTFKIKPKITGKDDPVEICKSKGQGRGSRPWKRDKPRRRLPVKKNYYILLSQISTSANRTDVWVNQLSGITKSLL